MAEGSGLAREGKKPMYWIPEQLATLSKRELKWLAVRVAEEIKRRRARQVEAEPGAAAPPAPPAGELTQSAAPLRAKVLRMNRKAEPRRAA